MLETEYTKHYAYRGDLVYNENMARAVKKTKTTKTTAVKKDISNDRVKLGNRVSRDKKRFLENRTKDDVVILRKILSLMIVRTSEMEKHLEKVLAGSGVKIMPNWDELFGEEDLGKSDIDSKKKQPGTKIMMKKTPGEERTMGAPKRKRGNEHENEQKPKPKIVKSVTLIPGKK